MQVSQLSASLSKSHDTCDELQRVSSASHAAPPSLCLPCPSRPLPTVSARQRNTELEAAVREKGARVDELEESLRREEATAAQDDATHRRAAATVELELAEQVRDNERLTKEVAEARVAAADARALLGSLREDKAGLTRQVQQCTHELQAMEGLLFELREENVGCVACPVPRPHPWCCLPSIGPLCLAYPAPSSPVTHGASLARVCGHRRRVRYESELTKLRAALAGVKDATSTAVVTYGNGASGSPAGSDHPGTSPASSVATAVKMTQRGAQVHSSKGRQVADLSLQVLQLREARDSAIALLEAERRFSSALAREVCTLVDLPTRTGAGALTSPQRDLPTRRGAAQTLVKTVRAELMTARRERDAALVKAENAERRAGDVNRSLQAERNAVYVVGGWVVLAEPHSHLDHVPHAPPPVLALTSAAAGKRWRSSW